MVWWKRPKQTLLSCSKGARGHTHTTPGNGRYCAIAAGNNWWKLLYVLSNLWLAQHKPANESTDELTKGPNESVVFDLPFSIRLLLPSSYPDTPPFSIRHLCLQKDEVPPSNYDLAEAREKAVRTDLAVVKDQLRLTKNREQAFRADLKDSRKRLKLVQRLERKHFRLIWRWNLEPVEAFLPTGSYISHFLFYVQTNE